MIEVTQPAAVMNPSNANPHAGRHRDHREPNGSNHTGQDQANVAGSPECGARRRAQRDGASADIADVGHDTHRGIGILIDIGHRYPNLTAPTQPADAPGFFQSPPDDPHDVAASSGNHDPLGVYPSLESVSIHQPPFGPKPGHIGRYPGPAERGHFGRADQPIDDGVAGAQSSLRLSQGLSQRTYRHVEVPSHFYQVGDIQPCGRLVAFGIGQLLGASDQFTGAIKGGRCRLRHDPHKPMASRSPMVRPGSSPTRFTARTTPGMNDERSKESWRMVSVWPLAPNRTS